MRKLLLLLLAAFALGSCGDYTEVEREVGYKGRARVNPWLAAERFAEGMGWEVEPVISWTAPDWNDSVWVMPGSILGNESYTRMTESWVRDGGHLVLLIDHANAESNDWRGHYPDPVIEAPCLEMLERAGIDLVVSGDEAFEADEIMFDGDRYEVDAKSDSSVAVSGGDRGVFASVLSGDGRITVLTDARMFRNRWIGDHDHAALLDALILAGEYEGAVGFMRGSGLSLWSLLRAHLWTVLLALALWVALWLWKNFTRFGPLESETPASVLRGYEHHLEALGNFQWRLDKGASLLAPLREQIVELGQRTSVRAGCRDDDFFQFLADRAGLPRERVFRALAEAAPADPAILTRTAADLQELLKVLAPNALP